MIRRTVLVTIAATVVASASATVALPWDAGQVGDDLPPKGSPPTRRLLSAGRVVKVDTASGEITIEHRPIAHLYMEAMTMVLRVEDPTMLAPLAPGDKIRFEVRRRDSGGYIITKIENAN